MLLAFCSALFMTYIIIFVTMFIILCF